MNNIIKTVKYGLGVMAVIALVFIFSGQGAYAQEYYDDYGYTDVDSYYPSYDDYGYTDVDSYYPSYDDYGYTDVDSYYPSYDDYGYTDVDSYYPSYDDYAYDDYGYGNDYGDYYGDDCGYDCGGYTDYGTDYGDYYGDDCGYDCSDYGNDYGDYYGDECDYSCDDYDDYDYQDDYGYGNSCCGSSYGGGMPSFPSFNTPSYNPPSHNSTPSYYNPPAHNNNPPTSNGSIVVNNNNNNTNNNTNNNNVIVNIPDDNDTNPPSEDNLFVNCDGSPSNPDIGDTVTWTADVSGGNGNYRYSWSGSNGLSGSSRTVHKSYNSEGTKSATVRVTDSDGNSDSASCDVDVNNDNNNNDNLDVVCEASPSNPDINEDVRWTARATGGDGDYTYRWTGDVTGTSRNETESYSSSGTQEATVRVRDGNGDTATDSCSVRVQPRGSTVSNVTVYTPPTGTPSAGVFLSQIPATGISPTMKLALFILGLFLWSAFGAYMILERRKMGTLATAGINASEMEVEADEAVVNEPVEAVQADDLESNLSFRARENNVLISRDGLAVIMNRANGNQSEAENILTQLVGKVSRNDGNYATLNGEKINTLLN